MKCLTTDYNIDHKKLSQEDQLLFKHIIEANDIQDL